MKEEQAKKDERHKQEEARKKKSTDKVREELGKKQAGKMDDEAKLKRETAKKEETEKKKMADRKKEAEKKAKDLSEEKKKKSASDAHTEEAGKKKGKLTKEERHKKLLGKKKEERDSIARSSDQPEINLMSALKLDNDQEVQEKKTENRNVPEDENILNINILVPKDGFDSIRSILRTRTKTPFSFTLTRKWQRKKPETKVKIQTMANHGLEVFSFDLPSPDDVVREAQKQSRAFNR